MILGLFRYHSTPIQSYNMLQSYVLVVSILFLKFVIADKFDEDQYGVKYADDCEICKIVSNEITLLLSESEGKHEVLETGYSVTKEKKKTKVRNLNIKSYYCRIQILVKYFILIPFIFHFSMPNLNYV